jgi:hypothetical protein
LDGIDLHANSVSPRLVLMGDCSIDFPRKYSRFKMGDHVKVPWEYLKDIREIGNPGIQPNSLIFKNRLGQSLFDLLIDFSMH